MDSQVWAFLIVNCNADIRDIISIMIHDLDASFVPMQTVIDCEIPNVNADL